MKRRKVWLWTTVTLFTLGTLLNTNSISLFPGVYSAAEGQAIRSLLAYGRYGAAVLMQFALLILVMGSAAYLNWIRRNRSRLGGSERFVNNAMRVALGLQHMYLFAGLFYAYAGVTNYLAVHGIYWPVPNF